MGADGSGEDGGANEAKSGLASEDRRAASFEQFVRLVEWSRSQPRFEIGRFGEEFDRGAEHVI